MRLVELGDTCIYRYKIVISKNNKTLLADAEEWVLEQKLTPCFIIPGFAFFTEKNHALMFMLKYSN